MAIDVEALGVDFASFSAHKVYGPMGVGALYVARDPTLKPLTTGGGQERGLRSGTLPTPLVAGFGKAAEIAADEVEHDAERMTGLTMRLHAALDALNAGVHFFGSLARRAPGTLSFGFPGISGDRLVALVEEDIAISTGAACSSGSAGVSHVIAALGCERPQAAEAVRVGLGRFTSDADIEVAVAAFARACGRAS